MKKIYSHQFEPVFAKHLKHVFTLLLALFATSISFKAFALATAGYSPLPPFISTTGSLSSMTAQEGTASASSSFNVSGVNMQAGIVVTASTGFEVGTDNATFSGSVTVGAAGIIASTPVYVRLAAADGPGARTGTVELTSLNAVEVDVPIPVSIVYPPATITAIRLVDPSPTKAVFVQFRISFDNSIIGLTANNLSLISTGTAGGGITTLTPTDGEDTAYVVSVGKVGGDGTLGLNVVNGNNLNSALVNTLPYAGPAYTIDNTAPTLTQLLYASNHPGNSQIAVIGDVVSLQFTADEATQTPVVTIGGHSVTAAPQSGVPNGYIASYTMTSGDALGRIHFALSITDLAGNSGGTYTDVAAGDDVEFVSSDATIKLLQISSGTLSPSFSQGTNTYTDVIANLTSSITLSLTTTNANATVVVNGISVTSGVKSSGFPMGTGDNTLSIVVTAQDGTTTNTYTITVTRLLPNNALLTSITLTPAATLVGATGPGYLNFTAAVTNATNSIQVIPTTKDPKATITVNGDNVISGSASQSIALNVGATTITTIVTAQDGTTAKTIIITVNRQPSADNGLAGLVSNNGTLAPDGTFNYAETVPYNIASVTLTPTTSDTSATVTVNGNTVTSGTPSAAVALNFGLNKIITKVTAQNGISKTYNTYITRTFPKTNAELASIRLSPVSTLIGTTGIGYLNFRSNVFNSEASVQVIPAAKDATATITVNGTPVISGAASADIALSVGANTITTVITAQDGTTTRTVIITVNRAAPTVDNNVYQQASVTKPTDNVTMQDDGIMVHQGLSPNGDGINDYLTIDGITSYPDNRLIIIDRNGVTVYQTKGYDNSSRIFDGQSNINGKMLLPGTYFYSLDYAANGQNKHKTGFIILKY